jgi:nucleoside-diphosphate-sugar epimerase
MKKVLVTGSAGFIGGYITEFLLKKGYYVIGIDNYSKYGPISRSFDNHTNYEFVYGDCKNKNLIKEKAVDCEHIIANAAMVGGISYFHKFSYDLLSENEKILAATFDAAIELFQNNKLKKVTVLSSSMVYENSVTFPTQEKSLQDLPPPNSTYGFQKLSSEYFARGAYQQYCVPFTIIRPFNCVGLGEETSILDSNTKSGNINLTLSHVLPDLVLKVLKGQDPLHILGNGEQIRHFTNGKDISRAIYLSLDNDKAFCEDFNISTCRSTTIKQLAEIIWNYVNPNTKLNLLPEDPYLHDVQKRIPDVTKAKELLGFETEITLEESVLEVINYIQQKISKGKL